MENKWAIILGCSTGHGAATAKQLASEGYGIIGFHLDRGSIKKDALKLQEEISNINNDKVQFWNANAADKEIMLEKMIDIKRIIKDGEVKLLMHSIAFGSTTNFFDPTPVRQRQMDMTQHVMAHCLIYWTQSLLDEGLLKAGSRVLGLTSEGSYKAMEGYGPVGVAKASLEAVVRQIGWELGSQGITANTIQAGITPTRALTKISENWEDWVERTKERNPMKRVTTPEDVAGLVSLLLNDKANFINCSTIFCDGGPLSLNTLVFFKNFRNYKAQTPFK
jgi:enoyl-[acyl-carrier-protein] reductase (NADH)